MNISGIYRLFPTEKSCIEHLERVRWGKTPRCPYCESTSTTSMPKELRHHCNSCNTTFSVTVQTIFHRTKLPLQKWFLAISLILNAKKGISARQLSRDLEINKDTAWSVAMRIRRAMREDHELLSGIVEMDETYLGGKEKNRHTNKRLRLGRGTAGKITIAGMLERPGKIKALVITTPDRKTIHKLIKENISKGSNIYTDEHSSYVGVDKYVHRSVRHSAGEYVRGQVHTNSIESFWALFKRGIFGQYHQVSVAYLTMYIYEFCYRYNNRESENLFEETLERAMEGI